jgi:hypothetical protein
MDSPALHEVKPAPVSDDPFESDHESVTDLVSDPSTRDVDTPSSLAKQISPEAEQPVAEPEHPVPQVVGHSAIPSADDEDSAPGTGFSSVALHLETELKRLTHAVKDKDEAFERVRTQILLLEEELNKKKAEGVFSVPRLHVVSGLIWSN